MYHFIYGGAVSAGVRVRRHEFFIEHTWKNSKAKYDRSTHSTVVEDSQHTSTSWRYYSRFKDQRAKVGVRWLVAENAKRTWTSLIGCGLSIGTTGFGSFRTTYTSSYVDSAGHYQPETSTSSQERSGDLHYSRHSVGGFFQMGSQINVYRGLSAVLMGELHMYLSEVVYDDWWLGSTDWYRHIEPSLAMGLRWDFGDVMGRK